MKDELIVFSKPKSNISEDELSYIYNNILKFNNKKWKTSSNNKEILKQNS